MSDDRSSQPKQPQPHAADEQHAGRRLVQDGEVRDRVAAAGLLLSGRRGRSLARVGGDGEDRGSGETDLLDDGDVLARSPDRVDGDVELELAREELGELGEAERVRVGSECFRGRGEEVAHLLGGGGGVEELGAEGLRDEGRVLDEVAERPV